MLSVSNSTSLEKFQEYLQVSQVADFSHIIQNLSWTQEKRKYARESVNFNYSGAELKRKKNISTHFVN